VGHLSVVQFRLSADIVAGLGKTVEAIALILLHRHPLSTPRIVMFPPAWPSNSTAVAVPTIDLLAGPPGLDSVEMLDWVSAERAAFDGTKAYDPQAQLHVTEVGVSQPRSPSGRTLLTRIRLHSSSHHHHC
jgi:E3 ubiquitin-protein ligase SHPRH